MPVIDYSTSADANTLISGIYLGESWPPQNVNNVIRQFMADISLELASAALLTATASISLGGVSYGVGMMTGSASIVHLGTARAGYRKWLHWPSASTLVNSANLICDGGANITTATNDVSYAISLGSGVYVLKHYPASGLPSPLSNAASASATLTNKLYVNDGTGIKTNLISDVLGLPIKTNFQPYAQTVPNMTIALAEGTLQNATVATRIASQNTATLTAPAVNSRKDIVYVDTLAGTIGVATGAENASPVDPAVPAGKIAIARLRLATSTTSIPNSLIDDIRPLPGQLVKSSGQAITVSSTDVFAHGLGAAPDDFGAYFVMGASTELGYTSGDRIPVAFINDGGAGSRGASIKADATNITATWGSAAAFLMNASTGSYAVMDYTKWTLVLWART